MGTSKTQYARPEPRLQGKRRAFLAQLVKDPGTGAIEPSSNGGYGRTVDSLIRDEYVMVGKVRGKPVAKITGAGLARLKKAEAGPGRHRVPDDEKLLGRTVRIDDALWARINAAARLENEASNEPVTTSGWIRGVFEAALKKLKL